MSHIHRHTSTKRSPASPTARARLPLPACAPQGRRPTGDLCARGRRFELGPKRRPRPTGRLRARPRPPARRFPPRQLGQPTGHRPPPPRARLRASPCLPPSPASSSLSLPFPSPVALSRAPAHPPGCLPVCPSACVPVRPACLPGAPLRPRAPPPALLLHIPTGLDRAPIARANVPGSESRSGGGPPARADRAPPARPCALANWRPPFVARRRRRARRGSG